MTLFTINQKFQAVGDRSASEPPSNEMLKIAEMFGIGLDESYEVTLYDGLRLDVQPGDMVFVTGPSGGGKSVLVAQLEEAIRLALRDAVRIVNLAAVDLPTNRPVVDLMRPPLEEALRILSTAGLADAFLLLRKARELSDGQRYRLRLALAIQDLLKPGTRNAERGTNSQERPTNQEPQALSVAPRSALRVPRWTVLVADEFCSTLDRFCARAVAYRVRRLAATHGVTVLAASAHDDLIEDLAPDVLVWKHEGGRTDVRYANPERGKGKP